MRSSALIRGIVLAAGLLSANDSLWSQKAEGWEPTEAGSSRSGGTLAAASIAGQYSAGQQDGRSEFVVSCVHRRLGCFECRDASRKEIKEYDFTWIIPPVPDFEFGVLGHWASFLHELATLAVGMNPPTPRHVHETVTEEGRWEIRFKGQQQDLAELVRSPGKKASLVLHQLDAPGIITVESQIPMGDSAFQAVLDACSDVTFDTSRDLTTCPTEPGKELVTVKVYNPFLRDFEVPEVIGDLMVWRLTRPDHEEPENQNPYRLSCEYRKAGGPILGDSMFFQLSHKLTECDETLKPMSVSCK